MQPIVRKIEKMGLPVSWTWVPSAINTLLLSQGLAPNAATGLKGGTSIMGTRLLSRDCFSDVKNWERVLGIFFVEGYIMEPFAVMGGHVAANKDLDTSLHPAWRKAIMHFSILDKDSDKYTNVVDIKKTYRRMQDLHVPLLDGMSVDGAAYFNEVRLHEDIYHFMLMAIG
jgi:hypothetical protein